MVCYTIQFHKILCYQVIFVKPLTVADKYMYIRHCLLYTSDAADE